jgi:hypothetical protein
MFVHSGGIEPSSARVLEKKKLMISNDGTKSTDCIDLETMAPFPYYRLLLPVGTWGWPGDPIKLGNGDVFIPAMYEDILSG